MNSKRLQKLEEYYESDPNDPFNIYALGMEYENINLNRSIILYEALLEQHPDYLPTYYKAAHLYWETENLDKANTVFLKGIEVAKKQKNIKTQKELEAAFYNFQMENDY